MVYCGGCFALRFGVFWFGVLVWVLLFSLPFTACGMVCSVGLVGL